MVFDTSEEVVERDRFSIVEFNGAVVMADHLMNFGTDDFQVGFGDPFKKRSERQFDISGRAGYEPIFHVIISIEREVQLFTYFMKGAI